MNKFQYKYENLLNIKEKYEKMAKEKLNDAMEKLNSEKKKLQVYHQDKVNCQELLRINMEQGLNVSSLKNYGSYLNGLETKILQQKESVSQSNVRVDHLRNAVLKASTERRTFEKLKEKEKENYSYQEKKEEERFVDQLVTFNNYKSN
ncbi:MAG: flagellar export protein FliJ [Thermotaleaceae bacterium]